MENGSVPPKPESLVSRMALNDNKAGMEGLDRDKINKIIMESSKVLQIYLHISEWMFRMLSF